ncbi:MAG: ABC transporter ATP-binding protein [Nitrososphaerota archaeon]
MLSTIRLTVGYGSRTVINEASLNIEPGKFIGVIGPNASGKSTLLKTMARLLKPLGGAIFIDGKDLWKMSNQEVAKKIGIVLTEKIQPGLLTNYEIVAMGRYQYTGSFARLSHRDKLVIEESLRATGALTLADRRFNEISDGEKQRVMIARALAQEPSILILDEPTTHLDAKGRVEIMLLLRKLSREKKIAIIASTHDVELAIRLCDKLLVCNTGMIKIYDVPEQLVEEGGIEELYGFNGELIFSKDTLVAEPVVRDGSDFKVFVIAGGGSGLLVYRLLSRLGYRFITGVLHKGDIDYAIAKGAGGEVIAEEPFREISEESYNTALSELKKTDLLIYTSPPIGKLNQKNLELFSAGNALGLPIIYYSRDKCKELNLENCEHVSSISQLENLLEKHRRNSLRNRKNFAIIKTE